jgi:acetoin utilization protein AcuC
VVVSQLGVDSFHNDPLTNLHLSIQGFEKVVRRIKELAPRWVALGGGGYDVSNVARAWTLAWAVMNGIELNDELPKCYLDKATRVGVHEKELRSKPKSASSSQNKDIRMEAERIVNYLKKTIFPKIGA